MREDLAEIRKLQSESEDQRIMIEAMRRIRGEMLESQRESYEARIKRIEENHDREIVRLERTAGLRLRICIALVFLLVAVLLAVIGILLYDFTHLDRGWFQMMQ